jgi:hypothetical protein
MDMRYLPMAGQPRTLASPRRWAEAIILPGLVNGRTRNRSAIIESVFRQVISIRWAQGVTEEQKQRYRAALDGLRSIPELTALTWGDDAGIFEGNFDFVTVMDFPDFAAARRYVEHPLHQRYVQEHALPLIGERVVVQHEWDAEQNG